MQCVSLTTQDLKKQKAKAITFTNDKTHVEYMIGILDYRKTLHNCVSTLT